MQRRSSILSVSRRLAALFHRNGYARRQSQTRLTLEGAHRYKKGDEIRLTANSEEELATIRQLLLQAGFRPGRPFSKGRQFRQPVYGRREVERFLKMIGEKRAA